jgi:hypothetical protein
VNHIIDPSKAVAKLNVARIVEFIKACKFKAAFELAVRYVRIYITIDMIRYLPFNHVTL